MLFQEINKEDFDMLFTSGSPNREMLVQETKWWKSLNETLLLFVGLDKTDKDWMGGVLGIDENGDFRAIDTVANISTEENVVEIILEKGKEIILSDKIIFFQEFEPEVIQLLPEINQSLNIYVENPVDDIEEVAEILAELSTLYRLKGGSGISFDMQSLYLEHFIQA